MKILIPVDGEDIEDKIDVHLGRAKNFIFFDTEKDTWEILKNQFSDAKEPCEEVAKNAVEKKIEAVIVRYICRNAFDILTKSNIKMFSAEKVNVKEAIELLRKNMLAQVVKPNRKHQEN